MPIARAALLLLLAVIALPAAGEWPQWRGADGLGVSEATNLPVTWGPEEGIRWRTELPGEGTSSPIVADGRIFVTTAYEGEGGATRRRVLVTAAALLGALAVWIVVRGRRDKPGRRLLTLLSLLFVVAAIAIVVAPETFYTFGKPGRTWRATGALALLGLASAVGWLPRSRGWRLAGIAALAAAGGFVAWNTPASLVGPAPWDKRLIVALPAVIGVVVYAVAAWRRRSAPQPQGGAPTGALALMALALLVFVPPNYMSGLQRSVVCLAPEDGEILWETPVFAARPEQKWPGGTYATPTPVSDGESVFAYFGAGIAALDHDGGVRWVHRFPDYSDYSRYGAGSSPVLTESAVIVVQEAEAYQGGPPGFIVALDKESGETLWRVTPEGARDSYGTPLVIDGRLLMASWEFLAAYDTATGDTLWRLEYPMMQVVASMARAGDLVAVSGGAHGDKVMMVLRLAAGDGPPEVLWETRRRVARVPSPLIVNGVLFTLTDNGILSVYEAGSGEELGKQRLGGDYFASLVAGDGKLYATSTDGATSVIDTRPGFERLAVNELAAPVYASPAVGGGCLLIRTPRELVCVDAS